MRKFAGKRLNLDDETATFSRKDTRDSGHTPSHAPFRVTMIVTTRSRSTTNRRTARWEPIPSAMRHQAAEWRAASFRPGSRRARNVLYSSISSSVRPTK